MSLFCEFNGLSNQKLKEAKSALNKVTILSLSFWLMRRVPILCYWLYCFFCYKFVGLIFKEVRDGLLKVLIHGLAVGKCISVCSK